MKIIDTSKAVDPNKQQPFSTRSLYFLQRAYIENYRYLASAIIGSSYNASIPYVIDGCVLSNANKDITNGHIFYNGGIYTVHGMTGSTGTPIRFIETLTPDATADPTTFSDGTIENVHIDHDFNALDSATATYDFSATDLVYLTKIKPVLAAYSGLTNVSTTALTPLKLYPNAVISDIDGQYSGGTFTPKKIGFYSFSANIVMGITASVTETLSLLFYKNGSQFNRTYWTLDNYTGSGNYVSGSLSVTILVTNIADTYELKLQTVGNQNVSVDGNISYHWIDQN